MFWVLETEKLGRLVVLPPLILKKFFYITDNDHSL